MCTKWGMEPKFHEDCYVSFLLIMILPLLNYQDLTDECREKGWKIWCMAIEAGVRGCRTIDLEVLWNFWYHCKVQKAAEKHAKEASMWR